MFIRKTCILIFLAAFLAAGCSEERASELKNLQGRWHLINEMHQGKQSPADEIKNGFLIFDTENTWHVEIEGKTVGGGSFKIDLTKSPKTIDYTFAEGDEKGKTFAAIYEANGNSFRHCGVMDGARPKDFSAAAGSEAYLVTFERAK